MKKIVTVILMIMTVFVAYGKLTREGIKIEVNFKKNSDIIEKSSFKVLDLIAEEMKMPEYTNEYFIVEGHSDKTGSPKRNKILSKKRAESVRRYFVQRQGIDAGKFVVRYFGDTRPLDEGNTPVINAKNRRVEIKLTKTKDIKEIEAMEKNIALFNSEPQKVPQKIELIPSQYKAATSSKEAISFKVVIKDKNGKIIDENYDIYINGEKTADKFYPVKSGKYSVYATDKGIKSNVVEIDVYDVVNKIMIDLDKKKIIADGTDKAKISATVLSDNGEVLKDRKIEYRCNGNKISEVFSTTKSGIYALEAETEGIKSDIMNIEAYDVIGAIKLTTDKKEITADGKDTAYVGYKVFNQNGNEIKNNNIKLFVNGTQSSANTISTTKEGIYTIMAVGDGVISEAVSINANSIPSKIMLEADKTNIVADNRDSAGFAVKIFNQNGEIMRNVPYIIYENKNEINDNRFTSKTEGEYRFYAKTGDAVSNEVIINAYDIPKEISIVTDKKFAYARKDRPVNFKVTIRDQNGEEMPKQEYTVFINDKEWNKSDYKAMKMGKYKIKARTAGLQSNEETIEIAPGYEKEKITVGVDLGAKGNTQDGFVLGEATNGDKVYLYPGTGNVIGIFGQYDIFPVLQIEGEIIQKTAVPNPNLKNVSSEFVSRGINGELKFIPVRLEYSRVKVGAGLTYWFQNKNKTSINEEKIKIDQELNYENYIGYNFMAEYEMFLKEDFISLTIGAGYEAGSTLYKNGSLNDKNLDEGVLKDNYKKIYTNGMEGYIKAGVRF